MARRVWAAERFKAAPQWAAIGVAVAVVVIASVVTGIAAPGHGSSAAAAGAHPGVSSTASHWLHGVNGGASGGPGPGRGGHGSSPATPPSAGPVRLVPDSIQHQAEIPGRAVNITIDDGPDPVWTPRVLEVLRRHHVHATFCMIGPQALAHPDLVRQVVAEGNRLCDHSVHHDTTMDHKSAAYQKSEVLDALQMIENASGGARVYYYRAPGGAFTPYSRSLAAGHGLRPLGWNVDTKDFSRPGVAAIVHTVQNEIHNGPTILFHDGGGNREQTVQALDQALTWLKNQGYAFSFPKVD